MKSSGLATILLLIPVLTVPALAIFGIPQFAPVVASPLGEGKDADREKRVGNSARLAHDELFEDVESIGSELSSNPPSTSGNQPRTGPSSSLRSRLQESEDKAPSWGDDLQRPGEETRRRRAGSQMESATAEQSERGNADPKGSMAMNPDRIPRYERKPRQPDKKGSGLNSSPDEFDRRVQQMGYSDEGRPQQDSQEQTEARPRQTNPRPAKPRTAPVEELTWAVAVERLNELDIRNFRLEPGPQVGSFVFICNYTAPDAPTVSYRFEAEADQPLKAVSKVLEQIVEWRQRR